MTICLRTNPFLHFVRQTTNLYTQTNYISSRELHRGVARTGACLRSGDVRKIKCKNETDAYMHHMELMCHLDGRFASGAAGYYWPKSVPIFDEVQLSFFRNNFENYRRNQLKTLPDFYTVGIKIRHIWVPQKLGRICKEHSQLPKKFNFRSFEVMKDKYFFTVWLTVQKIGAKNWIFDIQNLILTTCHFHCLMGAR